MDNNDATKGRSKEAFYAVFEKGVQWYYLWTTETEPKTTRGHKFHVHADYDLVGNTILVLSKNWYRKLFGIMNHDFNDRTEMIEDFLRLVDKRMDRGFQLRKSESNLPGRLQPTLFDL